MDVDQIGEPALTAAHGPRKLSQRGRERRPHVRRSANKGVINTIDSIIYEGVAAA